MTAQVVSRPYATEDRLQADIPLAVQVSVHVSMIKAVINQAEGITQVEVQTTELSLKKLEFEFPVTDVNTAETTIAQALGLSRQDVRKLVRYEVIN